MLVHFAQLASRMDVWRRMGTAARVAGHSAQTQLIVEATTAAFMARGAGAAAAAAAKATIEREATRVWARRQRAEFGQTDEYDPAALAFGLVERRNLPDYRTRFPMWQKVLYLEQDGVREGEAAALIGTDTMTIALELPVAYAHLDR